MGEFSPVSEACPVCGSKGSCTFHASYVRNIIDFAGGRTVYSQVTVTRLICRSCGHTHAILPDFIIPYSTYGLFFLLRVLAEYFARLSTVQKLCERFSITPSMLYRWRDLFLSHKDAWLGVLASSEKSPLPFLKELSSMAGYSSDFSCRFVLLTAHSFLQSHRNPAPCRQTCF